MYRLAEITVTKDSSGERKLLLNEEKNLFQPAKYHKNQCEWSQKEASPRDKEEVLKAIKI